MATESSPLVTAVIPTYGRGEYLADAVRSVVAQTYEPLELIVVDDCSPRPVRGRIDDVDLDRLERVIYCRHEENRGANAARNTGIRKADGDFVAFLDDDDRWRPEKIARQVATFREAQSGTGVVYTGLEIVDESGTTTGTSIRSLRGDITRELLCGASIGSFTRLMVRSELLDAVGLLDESLPAWQDRDLNIHLSRRCRFEPVLESLAVHRRGNHDQIGDGYEGKRDIAYPRLIEKHRSLAAEFGSRVERRFLATQTFALAVSAFRQGRTDAARRHLLTALEHDPTYWKAYAYLPLTGGKHLYRLTRSAKSRMGRRVGR
jgi:glycosyltransferase involved in cell wall biosynthesis